MAEQPKRLLTISEQATERFHARQDQQPAAPQRLLTISEQATQRYHARQAAERARKRAQDGGLREGPGEVGSAEAQGEAVLDEEGIERKKAEIQQRIEALYAEHDALEAQARELAEARERAEADALELEEDGPVIVSQGDPDSGAEGRDEEDDRRE